MVIRIVNSFFQNCCGAVVAKDSYLKLSSGFGILRLNVSKSQALAECVPISTTRGHTNNLPVVQNGFVAEAIGIDGFH